MNKSETGFSSQEEYPDFQIGKEYLVTKERTKFFKHMISLKKKVAILTVFKERCTKIKNTLESEIEDINLLLDNKFLLICLPNFLQINPVKEYFILVEDPHLIGPFGYSETIKKIKKENALICISDKIINFDFLSNPIVISTTKKCFIKCSFEESFLILFCVIKFNLIRDDLSVVVTSEEMKKRVKLFLEVFGYERSNQVFLPEECEGGRIIVFSDELLPIEGVDLIYLCRNNLYGVKESKFDFSKGSSFVYKINDVLKALTTSVCKGKKPFPHKRFTNLKNTFKN